MLPKSTQLQATKPPDDIVAIHKGLWIGVRMRVFMEHNDDIIALLYASREGRELHWVYILQRGFYDSNH